MAATIRDPNSKVARTIRLSITGECNLNCFYCKPLGQTKDIFQVKNIIQASDVTKLIKIVGELGVNKVVISGGEPLIRKDVANFVKAAYAHKNVSDVRLVTNGTFLKAFADSLRKMGLRKVDINLDTLSFVKYQKITGKDSLYRVLDGIEKVEKLNYSEIRVNVLLLKGINESEVVDFARLTKDRKIHIRFIEYHPRVVNVDPYAERLGLSVLSVKRAIDNFQMLVRAHDFSDEEVPISTYRFADGVGKLSFLSEMEVRQTAATPCCAFSAEGVIFNELVPGRVVPILQDLRRDAKEDRLHRAIEKVMMLHHMEAKKGHKVPGRRLPTVSALKIRERPQVSARR